MAVTVLPSFDKKFYSDIPGMESPFVTRSGKVLYYDPREGSYYDRDSDVYLTYEEWKKYYDGWGERVYTFVSDPNVIKINFSKAKEIGADYVISKFPISNNLLKPVCINCNNSSNLFLYKINPV